jgi:hypothetical protein
MTRLYHRDRTVRTRASEILWVLSAIGADEVKGSFMSRLAFWWGGHLCLPLFVDYSRCRTRMLAACPPKCSASASAMIPAASLINPSRV